MPTLYERLGGEPALEAAVVRFYEAVMGDPLVAPFFSGHDMPALIDKQVAFMTMAFGGPNRYTGRELREIHRASVAGGLSDAHFDAVAHHLAATLRGMNVEPGLIDEVMRVVGGTRGDVLNR